MLILLDCRPLLTDRSNGEKTELIISCVKFLAKERGVEWLFLVDSRYREGLLPGLSDGILPVRRALPWLAGWKIRYDRVLSRAVKKHRPDLFMSTGLLPAPRTGLPQCLWMSEKAGKKCSHKLRDAGVLFTFSEKDRTFLAARLGDDPGIRDKIRVIPGAPGEGYNLLPGEEKEKVKEAYAGGKEYFLAATDGHRPEEWMDLLKAFSLFKKRQLSNMQIVLIPAAPGSGIHTGSKLDTYKYRADTHLYNELSREERARLLAACYAFLPPSDPESIGLSLLNAWSVGVPILYAQRKDPAALAAQMMTIYKDERLRASLVEKGQLEVQAFSWERTAGAVWEGIERAVGGFPKSAINK